MTHCRSLALGVARPESIDSSGVAGNALKASIDPVRFIFVLFEHFVRRELLVVATAAAAAAQNFFYPRSVATLGHLPVARTSSFGFGFRL